MQLSLIWLALLFLPHAGAFPQSAGDLWWQGNYAGAEAAYKEEIAGGGTKDSSSARAAGSSGKSTAARLELAALYRSFADYRRAAEQYRSVPEGFEAPGFSMIDDVTIPLGESLYYSHDLDAAEAVFRKVLEKMPGSLMGLFGLGRVLYEKGDLLAADALLSLAALLFPQFPGSYVYLARTAEKRGDPAKAIEWYTKGLRVDGHQVELRYLLGEAYQGLERYDEAFRELYRLRSIDAGNFFVLSRLDEIRPRLAKMEEELIPVKTLEKFAPFPKVGRPQKIPTVRIGLNTDNRGKPLPLAALTFVSNGEFSIAGSGPSAAALKASAAGKPSELVTLVFRDGRVHLSEGGEQNGLRPLGEKVLIEPADPVTGSFILKKIEYARGFAWAGIADRQYRGKLEISATGEGLAIVAEMNLEEYLYSVVPSEMMVSFPEEALKAQAVIARSYALSNVKQVKPHLKDGFDLCDGQHCQVYSGVTGEFSKSNAAVDATRGEVLAYDGEISRPFFHSTCGGHTQSSAQIAGWSGAPYLVGVVDGPAGTPFPASPRELESWLKTRPEAYCSSTGPEYRWFRLVPAVFVKEKLNRAAEIGEILAVRVLGRNGSGYVHAIEVAGTKGKVTLEKENEIRRYLGLGSLRSNLFWIETKLDEAGRPDEFIIYGGGWGHGVGLCQTGASGMAKGGSTYHQILRHYYQNAAVTNLGY